MSLKKHNTNEFFYNKFLIVVSNSRKLFLKTILSINILVCTKRLFQSINNDQSSILNNNGFKYNIMENETNKSLELKR